MKKMAFYIAMGAIGVTVSNVTDAGAHKTNRIKLPKRASHGEVVRYAAKMAKHFSVPEDIVLGIIKQESNYNQFALGDRGKSWGLMQVKCSTAHDMGLALHRPCSDLLEYRTNLFYGVKYLRSRITEHGNLAGIAAYNSGTPFYRNGVLVNYQYVAGVLLNALQYRAEGML